MDSNQAVHMTTWGWLFLGVVWTLLIVLTVWCFYRVLSKPKTDGSAEAPPNPPTN